MAAVMEFAELLRGLTYPARQTLMLILTRGRLLSSIRERGEYGVLLRELEDASAMTPSEVLTRVAQLENRDLVWTELEEPDAYGFTVSSLLPLLVGARCIQAGIL
jgi:DNA-binding MarR family transcriptional regulator